MQLEAEEKLQREVLNKLRDHPNQHLHELQTEVTLLNRKMEPLLKRVEEAAERVGIAQDSRRPGGTVGMLAKMGGRMISYYSDHLVDLLLDDFLVETAFELQKME